LTAFSPLAHSFPGDEEEEEEEEGFRLNLN
jgi:hypothetical protein